MGLSSALAGKKIYCGRNLHLYNSNENFYTAMAGQYKYKSRLRRSAARWATATVMSRS
jgi:hypothetical protein